MGRRGNQSGGVIQDLTASAANVRRDPEGGLPSPLAPPRLLFGRLGTLLVEDPHPPYSLLTIIIIISSCAIALWHFRS